MKAFKSDQRWDRNQIEFKANHPAVAYILFISGIFLLTIVQFAEPRETVIKAEPYFIALIVLGGIFSTRRLSLSWDKTRKTAVIKKQLLGYERLNTYRFNEISVQVKYINANDLRHQKHFDADWFVLHFSKSRYLLYSDTPARRSNIGEIERKLGLCTEHSIKLESKEIETGRLHRLQQVGVASFIILVGVSLMHNGLYHLNLKAPVTSEGINATPALYFSITLLIIVLGIGYLYSTLRSRKQ